MITLQTIGFIKSKFKEKTDPFEMQKHESEIIIENDFRDGLYKIEESSHLLVLFGFHLSTGYDLKHKNYFGWCPIRNLFAHDVEPH